MSDIVVIGAGPAGVSTALALQDRGLRPVVLERADSVAASWRGRYDRLRLNTSRTFSHLPGRRFPRGTPLFPSRDQYVAHVAEAAASLDIRLATPVDRLEPVSAGWAVQAKDQALTASQVVVATGFENSPFVPDWPGRDTYAGTLLHSSDYRNPEPFRGRSVLVVGPGCSGMEIAYDLAEGGASHVWLAVRTPPNIVLRQSPGPVPGDYVAVALLHAPLGFADWLTRIGQRSDTGDLAAYGLPFPGQGVYARLAASGVIPTVVDRELVDALKAGAFRVVAGVESLDQAGVALSDGSRIEPEAVVCATGYRRGLNGLVGGLGILDDAGRPRATGATPAAPGLRFAGFVPRPGALGYIAKEGRAIARAIAREALASPHSRRRAV